ncbi:MAG: DMT family transporter [Hyphomicrobiales bacterium]|nr:DMT family transporter [Hyphomicrobiales bacterium]
MAVEPPVVTAPPAQQNIMAGALWMLLFCAGFGVIGVMVRLASADIHPFEIAFFRNAIVLAVMVPAFRTDGLAGLRTRRLGMHVWRAVAGVATMSCMFMTMTLMPLAEATTLTFTAPLFATVGAALFLGEVVRLRRWTATLVGFAGVMVVLRPGVELLTVGSAWAIATSVFMATTVLIIKSLSRTESPKVIVFYMALFMTPLSAVPAALYWTWPGWQTLGYVAVLGLAATVAQTAFAKAMHAAEASAVMPVDFARLIFAAALAYLFFGEVPDAYTWVGAGIILAATVYITHRESRRRK